MPTINVKVSTGADDGYMSTSRGASGSRHIYSFSYIKAGVRAFSTRNIAAVRFRSLSIPSGSIISSATLTFIRKQETGSASIKIYGDKVANAGVWGSSNRVKNITKTTNSTALSVSTATSTNTVTNIIQEIVNVSGWASGNNMNFGLFNIAAVGSNYWEGFAFEKGGSDIPALSITYSSGGVATPPDAIWFGSTF